jgi:hypothetical protein
VAAAGVAGRVVPTNPFHFGRQLFKTNVHMMGPAGTATLSLDVLDHLWISHKGVSR